mmetsp:Transcript_108170/g.191482  ORF Transcript_108170/g.191482 Transcript_108170/m.191482 type:complete len:239 (-) Transcript_108170:710-1426(-)
MPGRENRRSCREVHRGPSQVVSKSTFSMLSRSHGLDVSASVLELERVFATALDILRGLRFPEVLLGFREELWLLESGAVDGRDLAWGAPRWSCSGQLVEGIPSWRVFVFGASVAFEVDLAWGALRRSCSGAFAEGIPSWRVFVFCGSVAFESGRSLVSKVDAVTAVFNPELTGFDAKPSTSSRLPFFVLPDCFVPLAGLKPKPSISALLPFFELLTAWLQRLLLASSCGTGAKRPHCL